MKRIAILIALMTWTHAHAATFTVTNTLVSGAGSLRQTIADSNPARGTPVGIYCPFDNNRVGGANPWQRNVISGCSSYGIETFNGVSTNNTFSGNYVGVDKTGTKAIPNQYGIYIESPFNLVTNCVVS